MTILKKYKKSFTIFEMSIVISVLAILVGVLLTGRQIVDRANLQRVIFEIDYYKKALTLYRDTYDVYPGNMDEETCMKYVEFAQLNVDNGNVDVGDYCKESRAESGGKGRVNNGFVSSSLMATTERWTSFLNGMRFMQTSKIINEVATNIGDDELTSGYYSDINKGPWDETCRECISYENVRRTQAKTSFDNNGVVTIAGILFDSTKEDSYKLNFIRGSNNSSGDSNGHEFYDVNVQKNVNSQNVLFLYRNTPASMDSSYGAGSLSTGILTSSMANQLDIKLDNGRPGKGNLIALKNGYVKSAGLTEAEKKKICYNTLQANVSDAYYVSSTETKNGCNIMYIIK